MHIRHIKGRKYLYFGNKLVRRMSIIDEFFMNRLLVNIIWIILVVLLFLSVLAWILTVFTTTLMTIIVILIMILLTIILKKRGDYVEEKKK